MKRAVRIFLRTTIVLITVFITTLLIADRFVQFRMSDDEYNKYFTDKGLKADISYYNKLNRTIRYASSKGDTAATILFIHGAPSSLSYYRDYMTDSTLLQHASMFAVDRAGYGFSGLGDPEPSLEKQVQLIMPIIDSLNKVHRPLIIVGASYGTSIACRLAMDHPDVVDGLVLIAPALAPGEEKIYPVTPYIEWPLIHWFVPRMLQSANIEKIRHKEELTKMLPYWNNIKVPVIYMQGANDDLVYTTNAQFAKAHLTNVPYLDITLIPNRGHLIAFSEKPAIKESILKMIDLANLNIVGKLQCDSTIHIAQQGNADENKNSEF